MIGRSNRGQGQFIVLALPLNLSPGYAVVFEIQYSWSVICPGLAKRSLCWGGNAHASASGGLRRRTERMRWPAQSALRVLRSAFSSVLRCWLAISQGDVVELNQEPVHSV